jgi:hypothetical protein
LQTKYSQGIESEENTTRDLCNFDEKKDESDLIEENSFQTQKIKIVLYISQQKT